MRISEEKTFIIGAIRKSWIFVSVETDEGLAGVGEAALERKEKAVVTAIHELVGGHPCGI
jgi:galactonate dehydratase